MREKRVVDCLTMYVPHSLPSYPDIEEACKIAGGEDEKDGHKIAQTHS